MTAPPAKLLVLGIDASSASLVNEWMADGTMPNLAALANRGLTGHTRGLDGFFVGSTWPSLCTGTNPAKHGFHYQIQLASGSYRLEDRALGAFVERDPFWRELSRAGKRVAVLDVPLARIEPELNGIHVVEWGGHDSFFGYSTTPPELASEIESRFGRHPVGLSCDAGRRSPQNYLEFKISLEEGVKRRARWSTELLDRGGWDLFMTVFTEAHCAGHQCWHLHDATHPAHEAAVAAMTGDVMRSTYRAIDEAIGTLIDRAGDATIIVFSAHDMSSSYGAHFLLRELLYRLGVAAPPRVPLRGRMRELVAKLWRALPESARSTLSPLRDRVAKSDESRVSVPSIGVDVERSRCFPLANGLAVGGIRLNLEGREPRGILAPGDDADRFCAELEADLLAIVDEITGEPLVRRVLRTRDRYAGDRLDALPDLLVEWNEAVARSSTALGMGAAARVRARSTKIGTIEGVNEYGRSGEHRAGGWFVAAGPTVRPGTLNCEASLLDLAPTFTRILGVELPAVDGKAIEEIVRDGDSGMS